MLVRAWLFWQITEMFFLRRTAVTEWMRVICTYKIYIKRLWITYERHSDSLALHYAWCMVIIVVLESKPTVFYLSQVFDTVSGQIACWLLSVYCEEQSRSVVTEENWSTSGMWVTIVTLHHFGFVCLLVLACVIFTRRSNCAPVCVCFTGTAAVGEVTYLCFIKISYPVPQLCTLTSSLDWWGCVDQSLHSLRI